MVEAHDQVGVFSLEPEVEVRCVRATVEASGDAKLIVSSAGPVIHCDWWDGSPFVVATWATRWIAQGLMPVRPIEVFTQDIRGAAKERGALEPLSRLPTAKQLQQLMCQHSRYSHAGHAKSQTTQAVMCDCRT